eukprot:c2637_g1_i1.p1 GENE.c2637_g1_i1~~c2637_g1_i1.p1  ORF type:complete len:182 (+),score=20.59 c2637_g1_i1:1-546(+)
MGMLTRDKNTKHKAMTFVVRVAAYLALCLGLVLLVEAATDCSIFSTCSLCIVRSECGWCNFHQSRCVAGTLNGPERANCTTYEYGFCSGEPCQTYGDDCSCVQDPFCGWCAATATCMEGTKSGPLLEACPENSWFAFPGHARCHAQVAPYFEGPHAKFITNPLKTNGPSTIIGSDNDSDDE